MFCFALVPVRHFIPEHTELIRCPQSVSYERDKALVVFLQQSITWDATPIPISRTDDLNAYRQLIVSERNWRDRGQEMSKVRIAYK